MANAIQLLGTLIKKSHDTRNEGLKTLGKLLGVAFSNEPVTKGIESIGAIAGTNTNSDFLENVSGQLKEINKPEISLKDNGAVNTQPITETKNTSKDDELIANSAPLTNLQENVLNTVKKQQSKQIEGLIEQGVSGDDILKESGIDVSGTEPQSTINRPMLQTDNTKGNPVLNALSFIIPGLQSIEKAKLENQMRRQKIAGTEPLQEGERKKIELEYEKASKIEMLKQLYKGDISDRQKQQETAQAFQSDLSNLVKAWDDLGPMKGGLGGRAGGLISGTIGQVFGTGREARAKFESVSNGILYSAGAYIIGQSGRALVEADLKRLEKLAKFSPSMKAEDFKGKIQAILDFANSKITASGGKPSFTTADEFIGSVRKNGGSKKSDSSESNTPKVTNFKIVEE